MDATPGPGTIWLGLGITGRARLGETALQQRGPFLVAQSAEQLQEVDHPEARIAHRGICASPDAIFGSHRHSDVPACGAGWTSGGSVHWPRW
ncbi:MAG TPA: hypothetical protein VH230_00020 [Stellaceae bacterium]|nr:hypothetical protein [Stellaceae bacterium]